MSGDFFQTARKKARETAQRNGHTLGKTTGNFNVTPPRLTATCERCGMTIEVIVKYILTKEARQTKMRGNLKYTLTGDITNSICK
jgi:hypothetical protein